ncbi:hypothetical protein [Streptomyces litchfieldiae]|uniref:Uncharacterized protein n=1 Tax=Streptomyces litchfieldiae TaxID=3075543 RepID=A0ABU2MIU8_9ACTN|nr:hypothetical protein [Streptomyces sp. DSM 44938]MDT0341522.1 hypothetical protein [Streptomyces sp. DSM 44938]
MTEWVPRFDYPSDDGWLFMDVHLPDAAERIGQQIADRGGRRNKRFGKAVIEQLKAEWIGALELQIEPIVVYAPRVPRELPPECPASIRVERFEPDYERSIEGSWEG